jgi:hypothetical protein
VTDRLRFCGAALKDFVCGDGRNDHRKAGPGPGLVWCTGFDSAQRRNPSNDMSAGQAKFAGLCDSAARFLRDIILAKQVVF